MKKIRVIYFTLFLFLSACKSTTNVPSMFDVMDDAQTGLHFVNKLTPTQQFNIFKYLYFYNGAGIGAGDFNNDGKIDLFFAANQGDNKLYLNKGNLQFADVTAEAKIPNDGGWSTGVSVVDINNDGLLDIYICRVGNYETLHSRNQLLICQGIDKNGVPFYKDEAHEYGLDFSGFSTQAVFFDYDGDGDLDMYLLNHSVHQNGTFGIREKLLATKSPYSGDHIFRNNGNNTFTDVTEQTGIHSSVLGYGLGVCASDIDLDGYPDIYVGNDFHENDYIYINQHNGTFKEDLTNRMMHTSQFSMGVDIADLNNDGYPEIINMDMLPSDPEILKRSLGEDEYDLFYQKLTYGYNYQYTRNTLQFNRRNGMFSEVGLYSGVAATDWSWAPLLMDFDNDGLKDLFISNGISKRLNDMDYINYVSDDAIHTKMRSDKLDGNEMTMINNFPQAKIPNRFFKNKGNLIFDDIGNEIKGNNSTYSNGAIYADLDNDGDLDVVVNNIDQPALLYRNTANDKKIKPFIEIRLKGTEKNINALGAKVFVYANGGIRTYENYPVRGFMSSMQIPIHIGLDQTKVDSILLVWPDNTYQQIQNYKVNSFITISYKKDLPKFDYTSITGHWKNPTKPVEDITSKTNLLYKHKENTFQEFNREALLPHMLSTEGPALAVADINHDGLEDVFIGSSKWEKPIIFLQQASGKFIKKDQPDLDKDSTYEDVGACFTDVNNDGYPDLVIASGGNEYYGKDNYLTPRVYLNDGKANFHKLDNAFDSLFVNASCVVPYDFNGDGNMDLFIGGRSVPWNYGQIPQSYLLQNDGKGKFIDVTKKYAKGLSDIGFVTSALWFDLDKNGDKDLILTLEWGGIIAFMNHHGTFTKKILCDKKGWWNFVLPVDINNDGNIDFIAGNLGLNSRLKASEKEPVRMYYNDFDDNGKKEQVLTHYSNGREIQFANKGELEKQIPIIKKRFLYARDFAKASLQDIFTREKLEKADTLTANYFPNSILMNDGKLNFRVQEMPWQAQISPFKDAVVVDANGDKLPDILLVGNYYENNIQMGRYDADYGTILLNKGNGKFEAETLNGLQIKGQVRHIQKIKIDKKEAFILARNNDSTMVIQFKGKQ
ncbi:MAG: VCBS repeat-containing protein [Bacteroidota bacterium]|nr:VCBS repeat-containing protein [Bacteroidota bacterium]